MKKEYITQKIMSSLATLCTEPNDQKSPRGNIEKTHNRQVHRTCQAHRIGRAGNPVPAHKSFLKLKNGVFKIKIKKMVKS